MPEAEQGNVNEHEHEHEPYFPVRESRIGVFRCNFYFSLDSEMENLSTKLAASFLMLQVP